MLQGREREGENSPLGTALLSVGWKHPAPGRPHDGTSLSTAMKAHRPLAHFRKTVSGFSIWSAMFGNGPETYIPRHSFSGTSINAVAAVTDGMDRISTTPRLGSQEAGPLFRSRWWGAASSCVRQAIASATALQHGRGSQLTPPPAISASAASCARHSRELGTLRLLAAFRAARRGWSRTCCQAY